MKRTAQDRACLMLYVAELAAMRDDGETAEAMEMRATELLDAFDTNARGRRSWGEAEMRLLGKPMLWFYEPDGSQGFDVARAAGPDEVREMLASALRAYEREEGEAHHELVMAADAASQGWLASLKLRLRQAAAAVDHIREDLDRLMWDEGWGMPATVTAMLQMMRRAAEAEEVAAAHAGRAAAERGDDEESEACFERQIEAMRRAGQIQRDMDWLDRAGTSRAGGQPTHHRPGARPSPRFLALAGRIPGPLEATSAAAPEGGRPRTPGWVAQG